MVELYYEVTIGYDPRSRAAGPGAEAYESLDYDTVYHRGFATLAVRRSRQQRRCFGYSGATSHGRCSH